MICRRKMTYINDIGDIKCYSDVADSYRFHGYHDFVSRFPSLPRVVPAALICQHGSPEGAMGAFAAAAIRAASQDQTSKGGKRRSRGQVNRAT
eukprot:s5_g54.t1